MADAINPDHYTTSEGVQCHDLQRAMLGREQMRGYWRGCAVKYLFRYPGKGRIQDLKKAIRCIEFLIELETENGPGMQGLLSPESRRGCRADSGCRPGWTEEAYSYG